MQENKQHTHKNVTQDIPLETLIEEKIQPPKASITMYYSEKDHCNITMESFKTIATKNKSILTSMNPHITWYASNLHKLSLG